VGEALRFSSSAPAKDRRRYVCQDRLQCFLLPLAKVAIAKMQDPRRKQKKVPVPCVLIERNVSQPRIDPGNRTEVPLLPAARARRGEDGEPSRTAAGDGGGGERSGGHGD
jgi:hypothetical protein